MNQSMYNQALLSHVALVNPAGQAKGAPSGYGMSAEQSWEQRAQEAQWRAQAAAAQQAAQQAALAQAQRQAEAAALEQARQQAALAQAQRQAEAAALERARQQAALAQAQRQAEAAIAQARCNALIAQYQRSWRDFSKLSPSDPMRQVVSTDIDKAYADLVAMGCNTNQIGVNAVGPGIITPGTPVVPANPINQASDGGVYREDKQIPGGWWRPRPNDVAVQQGGVDYLGTGFWPKVNSAGQVVYQGPAAVPQAAAPWSPFAMLVGVLAAAGVGSYIGSRMASR